MLLILGLVKLLAPIVNWLVTSVVNPALLNIFSVLPEAQLVAIAADNVPVPHRFASLTAGAVTLGQLQFVTVVFTVLST